MNCLSALFIGTDLSDTDSNGRTLKDVFSFVPEDRRYCFCYRKSSGGSSSQRVFLVDESRFLRSSKRRGKALSNVNSTADDVNKNGKHIRKNPLTCLLRNLFWMIRFPFFKKGLLQWLDSIQPELLVFDPGDFIFVHYLAAYIAKKLNKKLVMYNTEDYYFKKHNYLHKERGFGFLYPLFMYWLRRAYRKSFRAARICFHNTEGLSKLYKAEFPSCEHHVALHCASIVPPVTRKEPTTFRDFYFFGNLSRGRDKTLFDIAEHIFKVSPSSKIFVNAAETGLFCPKNLNKYPNIVNLGFAQYSDITKKLEQNFILLSFNPLDSYNAMDKFHGFSTKISDYIASCNPIFHLGPEGDETNTLRAHNLAYVASSECEIDNVLQKLLSDLKTGVYNLDEYQRSFYRDFLDKKKVNAEMERLLFGTQASIG